MLVGYRGEMIFVVSLKLSSSPIMEDITLPAILHLLKQDMIFLSIFTLMVNMDVTSLTRPLESATC